MELRELLIDENEDNFGVEAISLVKYPAIEENFVYFGKQYELAKVDEERQMLVGPALIPNKNIYREDREGNGYEVFFTPETVQRAAHLFMRQSRNNAATVEHMESTEDVYLYESWIVENEKKDKQQVYGFNFPKGTWMVAMRIDDTKLWEGIKTGKLRGLSIEGYFVDKLVEKPQKEDMKSIFETIRSLKKRVELFAEETLQDGTKVVTEADAFEPGVKVQVLDEEGNPQDAPTGEHTLQNGTKIKVGEGSILESIGTDEAKEVEAEKEEEKKEEMAGRFRVEVGRGGDARVADGIWADSYEGKIEQTSPFTYESDDRAAMVAFVDALIEQNLDVTTNLKKEDKEDMGAYARYEIETDSAGTRAIKDTYIAYDKGETMGLKEYAPNVWGTNNHITYRDLVKFLDDNGVKYTELEKEEMADDSKDNFSRYSIEVAGKKSDIERLLDQGGFLEKAGKITDIFGTGRVVLEPRSITDAQKVEDYLRREGKTVVRVENNTDENKKPKDMTSEDKKKDEEKKDMGYRKKIKAKLMETDITEAVAEDLTEAIVAIVEEAAAPVVEEVAEAVAEKVAEEAIEKAEMSAVESFTSALEKLTERIAELEKAPADKFSHKPATKESKPVEQLDLVQRVFQTIR